MRKKNFTYPCQQCGKIAIYHVQEHSGDPQMHLCEKCFQELRKFRDKDWGVTITDAPLGFECPNCHTIQYTQHWEYEEIEDVEYTYIKCPGCHKNITLQRNTIWADIHKYHRNL